MRSTLKLRRNMLLFLVCVPILLSCQWGIWLSNLQPLKENVGCYLLQEHIKILAVYFPPSFVTKLVLALEPAFAPLCCNAEHQVPEVPSSRGHQVPGVTKFQRYEERPDTKSSSLPHTKGPHKSGGGRNLEAVYSQGVCPDCATGPPAKPQCNPVWESCVHTGVCHALTARRVRPHFYHAALCASGACSHQMHVLAAKQFHPQCNHVQACVQTMCEYMLSLASCTCCLWDGQSRWSLSMWYV